MKTERNHSTVPCPDEVMKNLSELLTIILSSLFEKSKDLRDKTLVCKNRNQNELVLQSLGGEDMTHEKISRIESIRALLRILLVAITTAGINELENIYFADFLRSDCFPELSVHTIYLPDFPPDYMQIFYT